MIPEQAKWRGKPHKDRIVYLKSHYWRDDRLLEECKTHEDRVSMGRLYRKYDGADTFYPVYYDSDGIELGSAPTPEYVNWLRGQRNPKP